VISTALVQINPNGIKTPRVSVGADIGNNLIVANGEPKDIQAVAAIVEQMDAIPANARREMRIIPLKSGSARDFATRVEALYRDAQKGLGGTADALILGDESSSRVIITASEAHLKLIEEIVAKLEEGGAGTGRQLRVVPINNGSATAIAAMLTQIFAAQTSALPREERLIVSALADDRTVVVEGPEKSMERALELVESLDAQPEAQEIIQTVHLKNGRAEDLATAVGQAQFKWPAATRKNYTGDGSQHDFDQWP
jgi:type II secretory pathway component GspD/PulD (secretin)